jgi:antitoxin (DNA-binding transcriptional repressor) of toxin-antitoxin stability system
MAFFETPSEVRKLWISHWSGIVSLVDNVTIGSYYSLMKAVGVKVLKARLSEYLRHVKTGETVLVTERDEVIAELRPAYHQSSMPSTLEEGLERLAECGGAALRSEEIKGWRGPAAVLRLRGISSDDLLDALREESK